MVIDNAKTLYRQAFHQGGHNVGRYGQMLQLQHQDFVLAPYLLALKNFRSRRLVSRFRCGCHAMGHGLHVDTGQFEPVAQRVDREQRFCLVCASDSAEDEPHFVFDCPDILFNQGQVYYHFLGTSSYLVFFLHFT